MNEIPERVRASFAEFIKLGKASIETDDDGIERLTMIYADGSTKTFEINASGLMLKQVRSTAPPPKK